ncbi:MAG: rhodanese-like domain-containing protein [Bacteroidetes bacterium HGW-Bacteroidetes-2]|jgi:rhodanese-related sulfurtransferase|nr:MAG: rhodanese-like domain-containing protein [Bacteroidetes bacterium HGW-Bacteroidetes-2]
MQDLTSKEWQKKTAVDTNAVILDVRTDEEVSEGKILGAKQINISDPAQFMEEIQKLDTAKNYYVYCRSGARSAQACAVLNSLGIQNTFNLIGGITDWDGLVE